MNLATANEDAKKESAKMSKLISDNGGGIGGLGRLMWDGIRSGVDTKQPCVFAHTVGEFTFGIILGVLTGGEALASTAVGKAIKSSVVVLDRLDVVSQVVSKTAGCALKITYKAGKPVFNVLYEGVKVLPKFFEAPVSGKLYSFIIPLPQVNLKGGIEAFKEAIAKGEVKVERVLDEADNIIVDEEGNILNKAITKEGEEVELLEKVNIKSDGLLTRLNNASFKVLKGKFEELDDVLKQKFLSDFDDVPDQILYKLQDEDLVDAWKVVSDLAGEREWVRKSIPLLKKMSGKSDDFMAKVKLYYSTHQKPSGSGAPPFIHQGTPFDEFGHPNFVPEVPNMTGGHGKIKYKPEDIPNQPALNGTGADMNRANTWAKAEFNKNGLNFKEHPTVSGRFYIKDPAHQYSDANGWVECVWHHHEDAKTMLPVPIQTHNRSFSTGSPHTGGASILTKPELQDLIGFFNSPTGI